jgi:adenosine deaminase
LNQHPERARNFGSSCYTRRVPEDRAEELELDEVQHGIAAAQSTSVMKFLADNRIRLNICPTSNVLLGRVQSLAEHPIRKLYDAGVKVTVNTDDVLVFGQSVSDEFLNLYRAGLSARRNSTSSGRTA